jgi:hypothetical protein
MSDQPKKNGKKMFVKRLGVSNGFPVLLFVSGSYVVFTVSTDCDGSWPLGELLAEI